MRGKQGFIAPATSAAKIIPRHLSAPAKKRGFSISQLMAEPLELKKTLNLPKTDFPHESQLATERA
jgi:hypothetical protein